MDNLKLGYGGTKSEMERLLADAQKLTGVKYDISNLDDVYNAIHAIQRNLGMAGTTAQEAEDTFSGAFGAMSAAWKDFIGNLAIENGDIKGTLTNLGTTVSTFLFKQLIPMVGRILVSLPGVAAQLMATELPKLWTTLQAFLINLPPKITAFMKQQMPVMLTAFQGLLANLTSGDFIDPEMVKMATQIVSSLANGFSENLPAILQTGVNIVLNLANGILQNLPQLITVAGQLLSNFAVYLLKNLPTIAQAGVNLTLGLVQGIISNLPSICTAALQACVSFITTVATHLPEFIQSGLDIVANLIAGLLENIPGIMDAAAQIVAGAWDTITSVDWLSLGWDIVTGIASGIVNAGGKIWEALKGAVGGAIDKVKGWLKIGSPSRLMAEQIGQWLPAGVGQGASENTESLTASLRSMTDEAVKAATLDMDQLNASADIQTAVNAGMNGRGFASDTSTDKMDIVIEILRLLLTKRLNLSGLAVLLDGEKVGELIDEWLKRKADGDNSALGVV